MRAAVRGWRTEPDGARTASSAVLLLLAVLAVVAPTLRLTAPELSARVTAVLFAVAAGATTVVLARRTAGRERRAARPWWALVVVGGLLTVSQLLAAVLRAWEHAGRGGWHDLPQLLAVPVALAACLLFLPRRTGRRAARRLLLDVLIVLVGVALLGSLVLTRVLPMTGGPASGLITVGYPAVGALLCATGSAALARAPRPRRRAAAWLLVAIVAMNVVAMAGAFSRVLGDAPSAVVTQVAWMGMLAAAIRAVDSDPTDGADDEQPAGLPLLGFVVSTTVAYGVAGAVVVGLSSGWAPSGVEQIGLGVLVGLAFVRSLLWAADGGRLTRRLLQTEAYFRALASSAEDVTVVLDADGVVTWVSGAVHGQLGWDGRDLTGRAVLALLHPEDRPVLDRPAALVRGSAGPRLPATVRFRTAAGGWRDVEISGAARAGVPGTALGEGLVLHLRDVTARRSTQRELERMAFTDYLTGLPNRARFMAALDGARARVAEGEQACVLLIDLDGFKAVNDVAGHDAGDRLLGEVADRLRSGARDRDLVARLGGDEFALLVPGGPEEAKGLAERLLDLLARPFRAPAAEGEEAGLVFPVSGSIGLARLEAGHEGTAAIRQADLALRAAKAAGKGRVRSSGQAIGSAMGRRTRLARDLPAALERGQLEVLYQPVAGIAERRVLGVEALVRWHHPLLGTVPPDEFIGLAEDDGLIVPLQRWVLEQATTDLAGLLAEGRDLQLGVNVSVRHLQAGCLAPDVARALARAGLPPRRLMIEVTESVMIDAEARLASDLATLRGMGCVISLDDFGRGYSSLAYLARLPVDVLKMDREFVAGIEGDERGAALVAAVVDLGRTLGMDVVAEGVETRAQLAALRAMGCRFVQGYLLGRPTVLGELRAVLDSFDATVLDDDRPNHLDDAVHLVGHDG